jgi:hypothetical protein
LNNLSLQLFRRVTSESLFKFYSKVEHDAAKRLNHHKDVDNKILAELLKNARLSDRQLAKNRDFTTNRNQKKSNY